MSKYEGLYTFDTDSHMYIPVSQVDDDYFDVREEGLKQPLIKDERVRKAVRAWAEANDLRTFRVVNKHANRCEIIGTGDHNNGSYIGFNLTIAHADINKIYPIAELCGEDEENEDLP